MTDRNEHFNQLLLISDYLTELSTVNFALGAVSRYFGHENNFNFDEAGAVFNLTFTKFYHVFTELEQTIEKFIEEEKQNAS